MVRKKEQIWRFILDAALSNGKILQFEQQAIAAKLGISTSTVFHALKVPRQSGAIAVHGRGFVLRDIEKLLTLWASGRNIARDNVYQTHVDMPVQQIDSGLPGSVIFSAYSAYTFRYHETPADYDKVVCYAVDAQIIESVKQRFPMTKGSPNLIILEGDALLPSFGSHLPVSQLYVDLWNLSDWFAADYLKALRVQLHII